MIELHQVLANNQSIVSKPVEFLVLMGLILTIILSIVFSLFIGYFVNSWYTRIKLFFEYGAHSELIRLNKLQEKLNDTAKQKTGIRKSKN